MARRHWESSSRRRSAVMFLTVAWVPTGMKTGVRTSPWRVVKRAARARVPGAVFSSWKARRDMDAGERREAGAKNKRKFAGGWR